jgi:hypothetical protein
MLMIECVIFDIGVTNDGSFETKGDVVFEIFGLLFWGK